MQPSEQFMSKYDTTINIQFQKDMPNKLHGLIVERDVYINSNLSDAEKLCAVAEEIGHYYTSVPADISDYSLPFNRKQELRARGWAYEHLVNLESLKSIIKHDSEIPIWDLADKLNVTDKFLEQAILYYKIKGVW